jgi:hypothetical protein
MSQVALLMISKKWPNYATGLPNLKLTKNLYVLMKYKK